MSGNSANHTFPGSGRIKRINRELKFEGKILEFYQDTMDIDGDHTVVWDFVRQGQRQWCLLWMTAELLW